MTTDHGNGSLGGVGQTGELLGESLSANDVQGGDTEQALGVEDASGLENLGGNGDSRVDGVGDDQREGLGAELGDTLDQVADNAGIDLEEVVTGHAGLAWMRKGLAMHVLIRAAERGGGARTGNASRDDNNVGASQGVLEAVILGKVASDFLPDGQQ